METAQHNSSSVDKAVFTAQSVRDNLKSRDIFRVIFGDYEFNRYFIISILLVWNVCLAGIGVYMGAMSSPGELMLLVFPTMTLLAWILAVQPMKTILKISLFATCADLAVIVFHLI